MPIITRLVVRDAVLVLAALQLWQYSHVLDAQGTRWATPVAILAGLMIPVAGFLAHEWGHLLGAWASRSHVHMPRSVFTVFLFEFRPEENSRAQFLSVSYGGFLASALVVALLLWVLSFNHLADRVALGLTVLGVLATFILEIPPAWRVYRDHPPAG